MSNRNSICTWSLEAYDFKSDRQLIDFCADHGFAHLDVSLDIYDRYFNWYQASDDECREYARKIRAYGEEKGVFFTQTHLPYDLSFVYRLENTPKEEQLPCAHFKDPRFLDMHKKAARFSSYLGTKFCVAHPLCLHYTEEDYETEKQINMEYFKDLNDTAVKCGVKLALENIYDWKEGKIRLIYPSKALGLKDYIDSLDSDNVVACIDTGHAHIAGESLVDVVKVLGDRVQALHLHDNDTKTDQHIFPGMGTIDWQSFKKALKDIGYMGQFNLEIKPYPLYVNNRNYTSFLTEILTKLYDETN